MSRDPFENIKIGYSASVEKKITKEDVETFAQLTGDYNALHMDDEFARKSQFSQRIVHGFLHASLLSTLIGMKLPGQGALYLSQNINFINPVFIGDTVKVTGIVEKIFSSTRILEIRTEGVNQQGIKVLTGKAKVRVLKLSEWAENERKREGINMSNLLEGKTALVTGASRGIGKAIAKTLAANGAFVWLNYNKSERAAIELKSEIQQAGGICEIVKADVTIQSEIDVLIDKIAEKGKLDILVNNAGPVIKSARFEDIIYEDIMSAFENIVGSVFKVTKAVLPYLKETKGRIINIVTSAALGRTAYNWLPYVTAKSALIGFSKNLAQELGPLGIRVNMVSPSMVETDLISGVPERYKQMIISQTPLRRLATVNDVANAVLFLASDLSDFITGDNILVTGGQIML